MIKKITGFLIGAALVYLLFWFVSGVFNPMEWGWGGRLFFALCIAATFMNIWVPDFGEKRETP